VLAAYAQRQLSIVEKDFILQQVKEFMGEENLEGLADLPLDKLPETVVELLRAVDSGSFNQMAPSTGLQTFVPGIQEGWGEQQGQSPHFQGALQTGLSRDLKEPEQADEPLGFQNMQNARSQRTTATPLQKKPEAFPESRQGEEAPPLPPVAFQETQPAVDVPFEFVGW
jgi:hypothetical protein